MSSNVHGNNNETVLVEALNNKRFNELNDNLKSFIKCIDSTISNNDIILAEKFAGQRKADLQIVLKNKPYNISVKMGKANSVHQEKIEDFIAFLQKDYSISNELANALRLFIWGDGTLDGSAPKTNRLSATELKKKNPEVIKIITMLLSNYKKDLINRFVFSGRYNDSIDYIYHGNENSGLWASKEEIFPYMLNAGDNRSLSVGILTFQAWNRSLEGTTDKKRGQIQLKCGQLGHILELIKIKRGL